MEVRLLKREYINTKEFYLDFLNDKIKNNDKYFTNEYVIVSFAPDFPIYLNTRNEDERLKLYIEAIKTISKYYLNTHRDIHFDDGVFWYSLFCVYKREYLLKTYPEIKDSYDKFSNIVIKKFDWENYIYKCVLAAQYINDNVEDEESRTRYYKIIVENLDVYNYIIKYEIFRNEKFLINVLDIIEENNISKVLKAKVKGFGKDERVGRRVIFELNKSYPVIISPTLEKEELKVIFMENLWKYTQVS